MKLKGDYRRYPVVHEHHIYDGPNRQNSEAEGLKVYLCLDHHIMGPEAVHNNHKNMRILHRDGQRAYERTHSRAEFMSLIGRNYLDEEKQEEPKKDTKDGFMFLEPDCIGCFGASENQCERCEEKRHDKKTENWLIEARKKKCRHCCLWCEYWDICRWDIPEKHGWIDIADDLPEPETLVLLSFEECDHTEVGQRIIYDDGKEAFHPWDSYIGNMPYYEMDMTVNAWMPLPKPYRRGGTH